MKGNTKNKKWRYYTMKELMVKYNDKMALAFEKETIRFLDLKTRLIESKKIFDILTDDNKIIESVEAEDLHIQ